MQDINKELISEIEKAYNLQIKNVMNSREGIILWTKHEKILVRRVYFSPYRTQFIHHVKEHLYNRKFENIDNYFCTVDNLPYIMYNNGYYVLSKKYEGKECDFGEKEELKNAVRSLAQLHKASRGLDISSVDLVRSELGNLPKSFQKRLNDIRKMKKFALRAKKKIDYLFVEHIDYFYNLGDEILKKLVENSKYYELINQLGMNNVICHHDYTHSNIIINNDQTNIINFDYCCLELKIYDVVNLLRRKMRKCNWDIKEAKVILDEYRKIEEISKDEFFIVKLMLQFPQKFWRIANRYYNSRNVWAEKVYLGKLEDVIEEKKYLSKFIDNFDRIIV